MNTSTNNDATTWLTRKEAAAYLRLSAATLANWASLGLRPDFNRIGGGRVLYRLHDVKAWMDLQTRRGA